MVARGVKRPSSGITINDGWGQARVEIETTGDEPDTTGHVDVCCKALIPSCMECWAKAGRDEYPDYEGDEDCPIDHYMTSDGECKPCEDVATGVTDDAAARNDIAASSNRCGKKRPMTPKGWQAKQEPLIKVRDRLGAVCGRHNPNANPMTPHTPSR